MIKRIYVVSIILALALLVLTGIQLYSIYEDYLIKQERFSDLVQTALASTSKKIEKITVGNQVIKKINFRSQGVTLQNKPAKTQDIYRIRIFEELSTDSNGILSSKFTHKEIPYDSFHLKKELFHSILPANFTSSLTQQPIKSIEQTKDEVLKKNNEVVNDVFDESISINIYNNFSAKIDTLKLDSILKKELTNVGVHTAFQYQLKSSLPYFNVQKNIKDAKFFSNLNINENGYTINLLPTNAFLQPIYLNIRFPHQRTYIVHEMITLLVISTLIILILIGSYVFFLRTIFQQKKLSDIKNDFVNNMTHELKTPIATLNLGIQYFNDKNIERTQQVEERTLKIMSNEIKRLNQLVESILTTATLEKAEIKTKFTKEHIHLLLNDIIQNVRLVMDAKGGTITMDLHAKNDLLEIDKTHFTNVINNLIDNAIKYCDKTPEINLTTYCNEKGIYISVKDNGPGIPKEHQKRVFEKFYRIPSGNTHNVKGFGLGLFYVKKIIDIHAGKIEIKSHIGKGSEFIIFLPFSRNAPDNHQNNC